MVGRRVLFISNGHGEDTISARILEEMQVLGQDLDCQLEYIAFPLVGEGNAYSHLGIKRVGPQQVLPTGGFARQSISNLKRDINAGLFPLLRNQIETLKSIDRSVDYIVCVGDILPLFLTGYFIKRKSSLVATAKSDYYSNGRRNHFWCEILLMKRYTDTVYTRDAITARSLNASGIDAVYEGNVMMDCISLTGVPFNLLQENAVTIGVLPGSRTDAYTNLEDILRVIEFIQIDVRIVKADLLIAAAQELDISGVKQTFSSAGWVENDITGTEDGLVSSYESNSGRFRAYIYTGRFGDILSKSDIVIGMSGTGNEQAVGMGKPVVTFPGKGTQFTRKFATDQVKLLGDSVCFIDKGYQAVSNNLVDIVLDRPRQEHMAQVGRDRMGLPGAANKIARDILFKRIVPRV